MVSTGLDSAEVRRHNLTLILGEIIHHGPASRSALAEATGLTRGAVTALSGLLIQKGVLRAAAADAPSGRGRPRVALEVAADRVGIVVATLDADHAGAVVTTLAGQELFRTQRRHGRPIGDPAPVLAALAEVLAAALAHAGSCGRDILDVTVVAWAPVGGDPTVVLADTDLGWGAVDVIGQVREQLAQTLPAQVPTMLLVSDGAMAALAEHAAQGAPENLLYLKSDSGIGGALIAHGRPIIGAHGMAGAIGHLPVVPDGILCQCGQHGCLVTIAGPDAVLEAAGLAGVAAEQGLTAALQELTARLAAAEPRAQRAWAHAADELARALRILSVSIDPAVIVLGGYLAPLADDIAQRFAAGMPGLAQAASAQPRIVGSAYGADAAVHGAVRSAALRLIAHPRLLG